MNPKENDNEIIELTDEELNEIFADDEQELYRSNKESKAFCLAFFVLQLLRDSNRATRQGSNSPGDCCGARVRAGARRSAPHFAHHTPPRLWPNLPAPPYLTALQGSADLLQ